MIFDHGGQVVAVDQREHEQIYPQPGWVEHDPKEIWYRTQQVVDGALQKGGVDVSDIQAVGITNQRETAVVWDRNTGEPVYNAIVWQDTRTDKIVDELAKDGGQDRFRDKTGLPLATYFSGPKIRWILTTTSTGRPRRPSRGPASATSTPGSSGTSPGSQRQALHITDVTNASRTC